jgi:formyltetrahydrofolate-dependent phosphoribosylglycinamide formyltransferase
LSETRVSAAVFASGSGTNFQALLDLEGRGASWRTVLLISDREGAGALERARAAGIATRVIPVKDRTPEEVATETLDALRERGAEVIFLAGYLRLVPAEVVSAYRRRILNVHPALLPSFGGKGMYGIRVHQAVLDAGARISGPTVHFVDERYDEGNIVAQWPVPVRADDTPETLQARVLSAEHGLYPLAADHLCRAVAEGREPGPLELQGGGFGLLEGPGAGGLHDVIRRRFPLNPNEGSP